MQDVYEFPSRTNRWRKKKKKGYVLDKTTVSINKSWPREPRAIFIYACIYVRKYMCICICMYVHTYKYVYTHI